MSVFDFFKKAPPAPPIDQMEQFYMSQFLTPKKQESQPLLGNRPSSQPQMQQQRFGAMQQAGMTPMGGQYNMPKNQANTAMNPYQQNPQMQQPMMYPNQPMMGQLPYPNQMPMMGNPGMQMQSPYGMQPQPGMQMQPQPGMQMQPQPGMQMQPQPGMQMQPQPGMQMQPQPGMQMQPYQQMPIQSGMQMPQMAPNQAPVSVPQISINPQNGQLVINSQAQPTYQGQAQPGEPAPQPAPAIGPPTQPMQPLPRKEEPVETAAPKKPAPKINYHAPKTKREASPQIPAPQQKDDLEDVYRQLANLNKRVEELEKRVDSFPTQLF